MTIAYRTPAVFCVYYDFSWDTPGITAGITVAVIPIGGRIIGGDVFIQTAFNASGTNNLNVGWLASTNEYFSPAETLANVVGRKPMITGINNNPYIAAHNVTVRCTATPAGISAGRAHVVINWIAV